MSAAEAVVSIDDDRTRVTTWRFGVYGDATGQHVHEFDYVVVPITGGTFRVTGADGSIKEMTQTAGTPYSGTAGTAHDVMSTTPDPAVFVEIEYRH